MRNDVAHLALQEKLKVAIEHALPHMPVELQKQFRQLLTPKSLAIMATISTAYGAAQFVGVGEVADVVLVAAGVATMGKTSIDVGKDIVQFLDTAKNATSQKDLEHAGMILAGAATTVAVSLGMAIVPGGRGARAIEEAEQAERTVAETAVSAAPVKEQGTVQQFFADRGEHIKREFHEHHVKPHKDLGAAVDSFVSRVFEESSPTNIAAVAAVGTGLGFAIYLKTRFGLNPFSRNPKEMSVAELPDRISFKARVVSEDAANTVLHYSDAKSDLYLQFDTEDLLAHAKDSAQLYDTLKRSVATGSEICIDKKNDHIDVTMHERAASIRPLRER